jgi:hypothetical protein
MASQPGFTVSEQLTSQMESFFTPYLPCRVRRTDESSFELVLADRLYEYPAERGLPGGLSTAFAYRTLTVKLGLVVVRFPNAEKKAFANKLRVLKLAAEALVEKLFVSEEELASVYSFDGFVLTEVR